MLLHCRFGAVVPLFTQHQMPPDALPRDIRKTLGTVERKNVYYWDLPNELIEELQAPAEPIRRLAADAKQVHVPEQWVSIDWRLL
jgi:hypothetical protein